MERRCAGTGLDWRRWVGLLCLSLLSVMRGFGQSEATKAPDTGVGTVTGRVTCADTRQPCRFAAVVLESVKKVEKDSVLPTAEELKQREQEQQEQQKAMRAWMIATEQGKTAARPQKPVDTDDYAGSADMDGTFTIPRVKPGKYYIVGSLDGYASPYELFLEYSGAEEQVADTAKRLAATAQTVEVLAGQTSTVYLTLERGAAVGGTVRYDDGTPVIGATVRLFVRGKDTQVGETVVKGKLEGTGTWGRTNDLGRFRFRGLPAGEFTLEVMLPIDADVPSAMHVDYSFHAPDLSGGALRVYLGDVLRLDQAHTIALKQGEGREGMDIVVPTNGFHSIQGVVRLLEDKPASSWGEVVLRDPESRLEMRRTEIGADGRFAFERVPEGKYELEVQEGRYRMNEEMAEGRQVLNVIADVPELVIKLPLKAKDGMKPEP